ncbi:lipid-A-disaccharide synthase N-terminal domain-containing protein [bacterium]|nr:lipid-A-disaccharide synthase N-terminal domain-containing protein [bacterium]MBU1881073.1 lipid-A-disaccharide synthase N-terminal domain-containing protein [bacterium]
MNFKLDFWLILGFAAQGVFAARFIVQWLVSEYKKQSVVPNAFWFLSLFGGLLLFIYAIHRKDPVFILGQGSGLLIYSRNLYLIYRKRQQDDLKPGAVA